MFLITICKDIVLAKPNGLSMDSYNGIGDRFKDKIKDLFKSD